MTRKILLPEFQGRVTLVDYESYTNRLAEGAAAH